jgi:hypothetical protein
VVWWCIIEKNLSSYLYSCLGTSNPYVTHNFRNQIVGWKIYDAWNCNSNVSRLVYLFILVGGGGAGAGQLFDNTVFGICWLECVMICLNFSQPKQIGKKLLYKVAFKNWSCVVISCCWSRHYKIKLRLLDED